MLSVLGLSPDKTGIRVRNESGIPLLVIASQLTPLYWARCVSCRTLERILGRDEDVRRGILIPVLLRPPLLPTPARRSVDPGGTFNSDNRLGMGKVWFTMSVSVYDEKNEPTVESVALK